MKALPLLTDLLRQGVRFTDNGGKLKVIVPRGVKLSARVKDEIRQHHAEIRTRLWNGGVSDDDILAIFTGSVVLVHAEMGVCARCASPHWWVSRYGVKVCARCFPPATPAIVVARISPQEQAA